MYLFSKYFKIVVFVFRSGTFGMSEDFYKCGVFFGFVLFFFYFYRLKEKFSKCKTNFCANLWDNLIKQARDESPRFWDEFEPGQESRSSLGF